MRDIHILRFFTYSHYFKLLNKFIDDIYCLIHHNFHMPNMKSFLQNTKTYDTNFIIWKSIFFRQIWLTICNFCNLYLSEGVRLRATRGGSADPRTFSSRRSSTDSSEDGFNLNVRDLKVRNNSRNEYCDTN